MPQPTKQRPRRFRPYAFPANDVDKFLNTFRALDRTVVEISMHIYKVPRRDRAAMRKQHGRLHDTVRKRLPQFFYSRRKDAQQF